MTVAQVMAVNREADWKWAIPTEDEWYKAAYHKNDGDHGQLLGLSDGHRRRAQQRKPGGRYGQHS